MEVQLHAFLTLSYTISIYYPNTTLEHSTFIYFFLQRVSAALIGHHRVETYLPERPKHVVKGKTIPLRAWTSPEVLGG